MGNRVRADITIGGRLKACCVPAFLEALVDLWVRGLGELGADLDLPADAGELEELLLLAGEDDRKAGAPPAGLRFGGDEVNYGNLDDAKDFCHRRGLAYHYDCSDGNGEFDAEDEWWSPERGYAVLYSLVNAGGAVPLHDLRTAWKDATAAEIVAWFDARTKEPGPLELVAADAACPGCVAEALQPGSALPEDFPAAGRSGDPEAA